MGPEGIVVHNPILLCLSEISQVNISFNKHVVGTNSIKIPIFGDLGIVHVFCYISPAKVNKTSVEFGNNEIVTVAGNVQIEEKYHGIKTHKR